MQLWSHSFEPQQRLSPRFAFGRLDAKQKFELSDNLNPHLAWEDVPEGTRSFALICVDPDAPADRSDVNQPGRILREDIERQDFYHWALVDLSADQRQIDEGLFSQAVKARGKPGPDGPLTTRQGLNSYTQWFQDDDAMNGDYFGYDGPCPPTNDLLVHRYHFILYALSVAQAPLEFEFSAAQAHAAIKPVMLEECRLTVLYSLNAALI